MSPQSQILSLLQALDKALDSPQRLVICGGVAVTLAFKGERKTFDVDVIAPLPLSSELKKKVEEVAEKMGVDSDWLNDAAKGFVDYLPLGWRDRLIPLDLGLKRLQIESLGRVDLIMMKLRAARERDLADIETLHLTKEDVPLILETLEKISLFDPKAALNIHLQLEEWNLV